MSNLIEVQFGARRKLERLSELPPTEGRAEGSHVIFSDGQSVFVLELSEGAWRIRQRYKLGSLINYLHHQQASRSRLERRLSCETGHVWKHRRCEKCGLRREPAFRTCRAMPVASQEDLIRGSGPQGERLLRDLTGGTHILKIKCRRRQGHDGPCGWEGALPGRDRYDPRAGCAVGIVVALDNKPVEPPTGQTEMT